MAASGLRRFGILAAFVCLLFPMSRGSKDSGDADGGAQV